MNHARPLSRLAPALFALLALAMASRASAQAWVAPAGSGSVTLSVQTIRNTGHLLTDGVLLDDGKSVDASVSIDADYAFTDRFSMAVGIPFVFAKYIGPNPTPFAPQPVDVCRCWQSGWQDISLVARYSIVNTRAFALTPSVAIGAPSHDYNYRGEAALGRDLKELRLAVDAGRRLDAISPRLSVQARYAYAIVEQVLEIPNNRSNASAEGAFQFTRRLSAHGGVAWQHTHGGLQLGTPPPLAAPGDLLVPGEVNTPEREAQHDRLLRDNNWHVSGGLAYSLPQMDLFFSYVEYVKGTDAHAGRAFTAGVSWPFEIGR